jgi:hypothetical protein
LAELILKPVFKGFYSPERKLIKRSKCSFFAKVTRKKKKKKKNILFERKTKKKQKQICLFIFIFSGKKAFGAKNVRSDVVQRSAADCGRKRGTGQGEPQIEMLFEAEFEVDCDFLFFLGNTFEFTKNS